MKKLFPLLLLLFIIQPLVAQVDTAYQGKAGVTDVADSDPGLLVFGLFILAGWVASVILCLIGAFILAGILLVGVTAGVISASVLIGWYRRSIYKGVKWFIYLAFSAGGMAFGCLLAFIVHELNKAAYPMGTALAWSIPIGAAGGLIAGWMLVNISRLLYRKLALRYDWPINSKA